MALLVFKISNNRNKSHQLTLVLLSLSSAVCTGTAPATFVTPTAATTAPVSFVPNTFFSFPYITTVFANGAACQAAVSQCSQNYAACAADLQGGANAGPGYAVTIVVPGGGGTTVAPTVASALSPESASAVCSSLSSQACFGLQGGVCSQTGTAPGGFFVGTANAAAPTAAPCVGVVGALAAGVGFGVQVIGAL